MDLSAKTPVKAADIEHELAKIWHQTATQDAVGEKEFTPRVRAILANLVLLVDDATNQAQVDSLLTDLCTLHPSRFFVISVKRDQPEAELATYISSRCVLAHSGKHVCSEEIYISSGHVNSEHIPNLLLSLFRPDVPGIFMVLGDISRGFASDSAAAQLVAGVSAVCERVIFDSSLFLSYALAARFLEELRVSEAQLESSVGLSSRVKVVRDLTWRRLERWRSLVAEQFDSPALLNSVSEVLALSIKGGCFLNAAAGRVSGESFLLAGWLMSRLGWEIDSVVRDQTGVTINCRDARSVKLNFSAEAATGKRGIEELEMVLSSTQTSAPNSTISMRREGSCAQIRLQSEGQEISSRQVPFLEKSLSEIAVNEILAPPSIKVYDDSVALALNLLERIP